MMTSRWVRQPLLNVAFQHAFAKVLRFGRVAGGPFIVLAHIDEDRSGVFAQAGAGFFDGDFLDRGRASLTIRRNPGEWSMAGP